MDLWIRTQDRDDLLKVSRININYPILNAIRGITENNMIITLGIYETEKRALEILDEIQKMLDGRWVREKMPAASMQNIFPIILYEMPEQ